MGALHRVVDSGRGALATVFYGDGDGEVDGIVIHLGESMSGKYVYVRHMEYLQRELEDQVHFSDVMDGWRPLCKGPWLEVPDISILVHQRSGNASVNNVYNI